MRSIVAACLAAPAAALAAMPPHHALQVAGAQALHIADLWHVAVWVCTAVFAAILLVLAWGVWRAPRAGAEAPPDAAPAAPAERRLARRIAWATGASAALLLALIGASVWTDRALAGLPLRDALHVEVTAHQWWWELRYDDPDPSRSFSTANELHVPVGRPVLLTLRSDDVIHSFWVPSLGGKKDLIPGRSATHVFRADRDGVFRGQCTEFCGAQHASMAFLVIAQAPQAFEAWAAAQRQAAPVPADALAARGREVFLSTSCPMCHAIAGTQAAARKGPDLSHVGSRRTLAAGSLPNTPQRLAAWIENPQQWKPGTNMPGHRFEPQDMQALVAYLGGLR